MSYNSEHSKLPIPRPLPEQTIKVVMVPWACPCYMYVATWSKYARCAELWKEDIGQERRLVQQAFGK
jgi:hypothetical protein